MRRFLILAFVIFSLTGYLTVSSVTTSQAQVCPGSGVPCIAPAPGTMGAFPAALAMVDMNVVIPSILQSTLILEAYFTPLMQQFGDGMQPTMEWTSVHVLPDWLNTFWYYNLKPGMQAMTRQLSVANVEQIFALDMFSDAANVIRTRRTLDDMAIKDHREQRPSEKVCTAGSIMSAMERANVFSDAYLAYGAGDKQWIAANSFGSSAGTNFAAYLNDRWKNNGGNVQAVVSDEFGYLAGGYEPIWCNAFFNKGYGGCAKNGVLVGKDVDIAGMVFAQDTIPLDPVIDSNKYNKGSLDEMVTNLAEAFGKDPVTGGISAQEGILNSLSYRTRRQVVYDGLFYVISRRVPGGFRSDAQTLGDNGQVNPPQDPEAFVELLKDIRGVTGEGDNTGCGLNGSPCASANPSRNEIFRAMIAQRFQSGKYALGQIDEPENNAREQVINQALQLMQMSDQLELMDHYSLLLASQIGNEIVQRTNFTSASPGAGMQ